MVHTYRGYRNSPTISGEETSGNKNAKRWLEKTQREKGYVIPSDSPSAETPSFSSDFSHTSHMKNEMERKLVSSVLLRNIQSQRTRLEMIKRKMSKASCSK